MKATIATPYFHPKTGGLENYCYNISTILSDFGHDINVLTTNHQTESYLTEEIDGVQVHRYPNFLTLSNTPVGIRWLLSVKKDIKNINPDCHISHIPVPGFPDLALYYAKLQNTPTILTYHNDLTKDGIWNVPALMYNHTALRLTLFCSDKIITTSDHYKSISKWLPKNSSIDIVPPGVSLERYETIDDKFVKKCRFSFPDHEFIAFTLAQLDRSHQHKGIDDFLSAIAGLANQGYDIGGVVGGSGDMKEEYKRRAEELGVSNHISFPGYIPESDLPAYYAAADVTVLASTNKSEGFGMILLESLAVGTPTIGTDVGGIPAAISRDSDGVIIRPGDVSALKSAILEIRSGNYSPDRGRVLDNYSWRSAARKTEQIMERISE